MMHLPEGQESRYLANTVGVALQIALAEVSVMRPRDPIEFLANSLHRYADNLERNKQELLEREQDWVAMESALFQEQHDNIMEREDHVLRIEQERRKRIYLEREKEVELYNSPRSRMSSYSSDLGNSMNAGGPGGATGGQGDQFYQSSRPKPNELNVPGSLLPGVNSPEPRTRSRSSEGQMTEGPEGNVSDNIIEVPAVPQTTIEPTDRRENTLTRQEHIPETPQASQTTIGSASELPGQPKQLLGTAMAGGDDTSKDAFTKPGEEHINDNRGKASLTTIIQGGNEDNNGAVNENEILHHHGKPEGEGIEEKETGGARNNVSENNMSLNLEQQTTEEGGKSVDPLTFRASDNSSNVNNGDSLTEQRSGSANDSDTKPDGKASPPIATQNSISDPGNNDIPSSEQGQTTLSKDKMESGESLLGEGREFGSSSKEEQAGEGGDITGDAKAGEEGRAQRGENESGDSKEDGDKKQSSTEEEDSRLYTIGEQEEDY